MKKTLAMICSAALTLGLLAGCGSSPAETTSGVDQTPEAAVLSGVVATNGSTSMESVLGILAEVFMDEYPAVTVNYSGTGSGTGVETALNGSADIGLASRGLKNSEKANGAVEHIVCLDGVAVIVNPSNPIQDLTLAQVADISSGVITNWSEIGGEDLEISFNGREAGSGTRGAYEEILGVSDICVYDNEFNSTGDIVGAVSMNPNAIGYVSLSAVNKNVIAVSVDGAECTEENIQNGSYPIQRPFVMITKEGTELTEAGQAFLDFATSREAGQYMTMAGAIPAN